MKRTSKRFNYKKRVVRENRLNEEIRAPKVRVLQDEGAAEVMSTEAALALAKERNQDLVEIAMNKDMPIVRIIDYGKFKFEKAKKDKESKKRQKVIQVKEIKVGPKIDVGDFDRKCQLAQEFLEEGDNVKVSMRFRGREMAHTEIGLEKLKEFAEVLKDDATVEKNPQLEGRVMTMILRPKAKKGSKDKELKKETKKEEHKKESRALSDADAKAGENTKPANETAPKKAE